MRDIIFGEDASHVREGSAPQVVTALRNLAIGLLCTTMLIEKVYRASESWQSEIILPSGYDQLVLEAL